MKLLLLIVILFSVSCDFFSTENEKIVGNLYVISPFSETNRRQIFVYMDGSGINNNIIEENVLGIQGDDSILAVRGINVGSQRFYSLRHTNGKSPLILDTISEKEYDQLLERIESKYKFSAPRRTVSK